jgi:hypothetical protein
MVNFFVPGLSPDAAEQLYAELQKYAGGLPKHPTARLRLIRWLTDDGQTLCTASVGENIDCGPMDQVYASAGITRVITETETFAQIHTASSPIPVIIVSGSIIGRAYFDDFKPPVADVDRPEKS